MKRDKKTYCIIDRDVVLMENQDLQGAKFWSILKSIDRKSGEVYVADKEGKCVFEPKFSIVDSDGETYESGLTWDVATRNEKYYKPGEGQILMVVADQNW